VLRTYKHELLSEGVKKRSILKTLFVKRGKKEEKQSDKK